jgi:hypothetical protein
VGVGFGTQVEAGLYRQAAGGKIQLVGEDCLAFVHTVHNTPKQTNEWQNSPKLLYKCWVQVNPIKYM